MFCPPCHRKSASTKVERLSLTQAEVNEAANGKVYNTDPNSDQIRLWSAHPEVFNFTAVKGVMLY